MKSLTIIFLLTATSLCAQEYKLVNGVQVQLSEVEKAEIRAQWAANDLARVKYSIGQSDKRFAYAVLKQKAKATEGIRVDSLSIAQMRLLFSLMLFKEGAIDSVRFTVKPIEGWIK